jgi:hypothetical protein
MKQVNISVIAPNLDVIAVAGTIDSRVLTHTKIEAAT